MESPEYERKRMARVKELEQMVKKLEQENKQLLTRVKTSASQSAERQPQPKGPGSRGEGGRGKELARLDSLEDGIIDLNSVNDEGGPDDEWLYKSPACPPTPSQKQVTPLKWLSEGHASSKTLTLPSLDDVRKSLSFTIDEAENLSREPGPRTSPPLVAKNKTAQKYLEQVRARRLSPPAASQDENQTELHPAEGAGLDTSGDIPVVRWKARVPVSPTASGGMEEVPKVSWSPRSARRRPAEGGLRSPVAEDQVEESEVVPKVSWKGPVQVPSDDLIPKVRWKPRAVVDDENEIVQSQARGEQIPKVHWKPRQVVDDEEEMETAQSHDASFGAGDEHIPKVHWKRRPVASPPENNDREVEGVPKINWNSPRRARRNPPQQGDEQEEIPKVSWKKPVVPEAHQEAGDAIPVVQWKPQNAHGSSPRAADSSPRQSKHRNIPVKAIVTYRGRRPDEDQLSQESFGSGSEGGELGNGRDSDVSLEDESGQPVQRPSRYQTHQPSVRQPGRGIQLPRHADAVSPPVSRNLGSRSPSPLLHTTPQLQSRSRSPSPSSAVRRGQQTSSVIPQPGQRQRQRTSSHNSPRNLSPASRSNVSAGAPSSSITSNGSPGRRKVVSLTGNSPQFTSPANTTPIATSRHPSGLPHHPTSSGSRTRPARTSLQSPKTGRDPSPRATPGRSGLTPPSGGRQAQQRSQGKPGRRGLPAAQSGNARSPSDGGVRSRQGPAAQSRRPVKQAEPTADDDSWLEGCF